MAIKIIIYSYKPKFQLLWTLRIGDNHDLIVKAFSEKNSKNERKREKERKRAANPSVINRSENEVK